MWKEVRIVNHGKSCSSYNQIGGIEGARNIATLWKNKYCNLYNSSKFIKDQTNIQSFLEGEGGDDWMISTVIFRECIKSLEVGKVAGADELCAEMI